MRRIVEDRLRRLWRGERSTAVAPVAVLAAPLSVLFGVGVRTRNFLYDRGIFPSHSSGIPVISVGNLAVGGTGKTPLSGWLAGALAHRDWKPAIVLRGYGEDEILLHRRWNPRVPVLRAHRRREGIAEAERGGADIAILDDGFQHRAVRRTLDLLLLSPEHPLPPRLLPRGPFREPLSAIRRADWVLVVAKGDAELEMARSLAREISRIRGAARVELFPFVEGEWTALSGAPAPPPGGSPIVVTSVALPDPFVRSVGAHFGALPRHLAFPDHHPYSSEDAAIISAFADGAWIATTEKDAVKLLPFRELLPEVRVLPLVPAPPPSLEADLLDSLAARARSGEPR